MKNTKGFIFFIIGICLVLLGLLISFLPFYLIIGIPVFATGVVFSWLSNRKVYVKILLTILPVLLWFPGTILVERLSTHYCEPETFLIPQNYHGYIRIIYNEKCGTHEYEGKRRLYRIPADGILITDFPSEYGEINQEYYFVDNVGKRTKIAMDDTAAKVYILESATTGSFSIKDQTYDYQECLLTSVGSKDSIANSDLISSTAPKLKNCSGK